ncbi:MAG: peptide chain release factor-like protein [Atopobiaceae bacterium]
MEQGRLSHKDYARLAQQSDRQIEKSCHVEAFHASGPGGQGVNTADSAVRMVHVPTGITVVSRESRSQYQNRQLCLQKLRQEFSRRAKVPKHRRKTRPSKAQRQKRLDQKRIRSQVKRLRQRPLD